LREIPSCILHQSINQRLEGEEPADVERLKARDFHILIEVDKIDMGSPVPADR